MFGMAPHRVVGWSLVPLVAIALSLLAPPPAARGDGDPASDYLITNQVFLTSQSASVSDAERRLLTAVRDANRRGFAIRVAVISSEYDLGSVTALWRKPDVYAKFLGLELASSYRQRLLVVMPNGFGFNWIGHPEGPSAGLLAALTTGGQGGLAAAAQAAVRRLAGAGGVTLAPARASGQSGGTDIAAIAGMTLAALAVLTGLLLALRRPWRRRRRLGGVLPSPRPRRQVAVRLRWAVPAVAVLGAVAIATPILTLRPAGISNVSSASVITPPPFSWTAGARPAPNFQLRDQSGRPVSIGSYRGREVIVTFIDPLCRNLCPLEAQALNQVERRLPASRRPPIVAVSVDVYANTRPDLLQDVREWHLVPQWRWAVGDLTQLRAVWDGYNVGVRVTTKRIAGTTINYITHTEAAYVIDPNGYERALFLWPFYPQDMISELRRLA